MEMESRILKMEIFTKAIIKIINSKEKEHIFGKPEPFIRENSEMERGMVMEFGGQGRIIMTYTKESMHRIIRMGMVFINGPMEQSIKVLLKMISSTVKDA